MEEIERIMFDCIMEATLLRESISKKEFWEIIRHYAKKIEELSPQSTEEIEAEDLSWLK